MIDCLHVSRSPDEWLMVLGEHGQPLVSTSTFNFTPESAEVAKARPWFFTGSPFGADIVGLAWERHSVGIGGKK